MAKRCTMQAVIHPGDESGHMAECIDLAVITQGRTLDETVQNLREALQLHLEGEDLIEGRRSSVPPSDQAGDGHRIGKAKPRCADGNVEQCVGACRSQKAGVKHALPGDHRGRPLDLRSPRSRSSRLHRRRGDKGGSPCACGRSMVVHKAVAALQPGAGAGTGAATKRTPGRSRKWASWVQTVAPARRAVA